MQVTDVSYAWTTQGSNPDRVERLVAGSGIEFEDRGAHELKGVPGEWRLYAVAAA